MGYTDVLHQIKQKKIAPVYLLYGTESYFIQTIIKQLEISVLNGEIEENLSVYDLEETPIQDVIIDAETYPFFGEKKLIIAHNPLFLKPKPDKLSFEHELDALIQYLKQPVDYSILVFIAPYDKIDERKKISKVMKQHAVSAECNPIKDYELKQWIPFLAENLHITIEDDAFDVLAGELSTNLYQVENELVKLATYASDHKITKEMVEILTPYTETGSSLQLVDAVINRNLYDALSIYKDLEKNNEEPIRLIGLLAFQFRTILQVKLMKNKGYTPYQMQKQTGSHPYVIKMAGQREKNFAVRRLEWIMDRLTRTDMAIKQGNMDQNLAFELLLYELAG